MRRIIFGMVAMVVLGIATITIAGETTPTDFKAGYLELDALKQKMADNGLQVLGTHQVAENKDYTVVAYTSADLKKAAQRIRQDLKAFNTGNLGDAICLEGNSGSGASGE